MFFVELTWLTFLIAALATYRVASMVAEEEGPFSLFLKLRTKAAQRNIPSEKNWIARGVRCPLCVSFWVGWVFAIPFYQSPAQYAFTALALSGVTVVLKQFQPE